MKFLVDLVEPIISFVWLRAFLVETLPPDHSQHDVFLFRTELVAPAQLARWTCLDRFIDFDHVKVQETRIRSSLKRLDRSEWMLRYSFLPRGRV